MSTENNNIEKRFSSSFEDYKHDLNLDEAWAAVESEIEEKKKRRFFWWIWPVGGLAITAIAFFIFNQNKNTNKEATIHAEVATHLENEHPSLTQQSDDQRSMTASGWDGVRSQAKDTLTFSSAINDATAIQSNGKATSKNDEDIQLLNTTTKTADVKKRKINDRLNSIKTTSENKIINRTNGKVRVSETGDPSVIHKDAEGLNPTTSENTTTLYQLGNGLGKINNTPDYPEKSKKLRSEINSNHVVSEVDEFNIQKNGVNLITEETTSTPNSPDDSQSILAKLSLLPISMFPIKVNEMTVVTVAENKIILEKKAQQNKFYIELYGGGLINNINTEVNAAIEQTDPNYLERWNQTQTPLGGYQVGLNVGKTIWKRLELSTGINFQKIINKIEWRENVSTSQRVVWDDEAFYSIDDQGVRTTSGGQVIETEVRYRMVKAKQTHNYVNFPIQLGYSKLFNKYSVGLHAGPVINLSHSFQGRILSNDADIRTLTTENYETIYRTSVGLSGLADLRLGRSVGKSSEIFTSLSYQYNGSNIIRDDFDIKMTNHNLSFNFGMRQHIN